MNLSEKYIISVFFVLGFIILLYFSFENIKETPPVWMDEGIIIQTARNLSNFGVAGLRIDSNTIVSAGYVTTSYPVTLPIAGVFHIFGVDILNARIVMAVFIIFLIISVLFWLNKNISPNIYITLLSLFLIVTFPPLYGDGKNVLGEIPGLFFLFMSMISLEYAYYSYLNSDSLRDKVLLTVTTFFLVGVTVVTKPIFIILLPAIITVLLFYLLKHRHNINYKYFSIILLFGMISFLLPIILWIHIQFHGETIKEMLSIYANPHSTNLLRSIITNLKRFVTESQPIYTLLMILVWTVALFIRLKKGYRIKISESVLYLFSILIILAYLRTIGYYRYFLLGEFVAITVLFTNISYLTKTSLKAIYITSIILIGIQSYQLLYTSWIAQYRNSSQSSELKMFLGNIPEDKEIFVYQAPELTTFISHENYSQFMDITETIRVGSTSLDRIRKGLPSVIATNSQYTDLIKKLSGNKYYEYNLIGKYQFLFKK